MNTSHLPSLSPYSGRNHSRVEEWAVGKLTDTYGSLLGAVSLAARAHKNQLRKDNLTPYASHPFRVCLIVLNVFGFNDPDMLLAALLHDMYEDTTTDFDDLAEQYGNTVAHWVGLLSKDSRLPENEREQAYCQALRDAPWQVKVCKLADMFDNLMDLCNLPRNRWPKTLARMETYLETLEQGATADMRRPIEIVQSLLQEQRDAHTGTVVA